MRVGKPPQNAFVLCAIVCILVMAIMPNIQENPVIIDSVQQTYYADDQSSPGTPRILIATMLTDGVEQYARGAIALIRGIKRNTTFSQPVDFLVLEIDTKPIRDKMTRRMLMREGWSILRVPRIAPESEFWTGSRFKDQFSKLNLWRLTQYQDRIIYFDSDCLVVGNLNEMLAMDLSAYPIWVSQDIRQDSVTNTFNMGVFMIRPSNIEFMRLMSLKASGRVAFETAMAEQGFLNAVYQDNWGEIGFRNNANLALFTIDRNRWDNENRTRPINVIHYTMNKPFNGCRPEYASICALWTQEGV